MSVADFRRQQLTDAGLKHLYYVSKLANLPSILKHGILPKNEIMRKHLSSESFAEETVQERRNRKNLELSDGSIVKIHDVVPLYFVTRTPTLSARREIQSDLAFIEISSEVVCDESNLYAFTDGNAASDDTIFFPSLFKLDEVPHKILHAPYWTNFPDGKRQRCAEFFIYPWVSVSYFRRLLVVGEKTADRCQQLVDEARVSVPVAIEPAAFFA